MKIVAISDTHDQHNKITIPECDILIHAGDATCHRRFREQDYLDFISWLKSQPARHIVMIAGNHDTMWQTNYWQYSNQQMIKDLVAPIHYLQDSMIEIEGLKIYGSPWTPLWDQWAFQKDDDELKNTWYNIPDWLDVLIVHGPPRGLLDQDGDHPNYGSVSLRAHLNKMVSPPKICIFGHVHNKGQLLNYYNVAMCQAIQGHNNNLVNSPTIIEINNY